jgi:hypothetical protein
MNREKRFWVRGTRDGRFAVYETRTGAQVTLPVATLLEADTQRQDKETATPHNPLPEVHDA